MLCVTPCFVTPCFARGADCDSAVLTPVNLGALAGCEVELEEGFLLARSDATHVHVDEGEAALVARLAQALEDLLGAVRMGIEPAHDLVLEGWSVHRLDKNLCVIAR